MKPTPVETKHYAALVGKTVTAIEWHSFERRALPVLIFNDGTNAAVMRDPEGNGVGFLDIQSGKCVVLSPDNLPIQPEPFNSEQEARQALSLWLNQFVPQGYYTTANGERIPARRVANRCIIQYL